VFFSAALTAREADTIKQIAVIVDSHLLIANSPDHSYLENYLVDTFPRRKA